MFIDIVVTEGVDFLPVVVTDAPVALKKNTDLTESPVGDRLNPLTGIRRLLSSL